MQGVPDFAARAAAVQELHAALGSLALVCQPLDLAPLSGREWYEVLVRKLLPQLGDEPFLVVAVVGGTNIGKSVIFNHLAGSRASATSPLASGTKHPVCLVPDGFAEQHDLPAVFPGFELSPWTSSEEALENHAEHRLYWKPSPQLSPRLLVLDTPDIDSDAPVNWVRADFVRHCADVLVAVLTQQKYNDAAVKQFFRKAAQEDKAVMIVFNQCLLPEDEEFWPLWLETFTRETGLKPERVYLAPNDRRAAEENRLPFLPRNPGDAAPVREEPRSLMADLAELHFAETKLRTLRGSLRQVLSRETGAPAYLGEIERKSADFRSAAELLSARQLARIGNWPALPNELLVREIRNWWRGRREGWTRSVHDFYNTVGETVLWPFSWARQHFSGPPPDPLESYRQQEREVILSAIQTAYEELTQLSQLGNELLRPRLAQLLSGDRRVQLLEAVGNAHGAVDFTAEIREVVQSQMESFQSDSPQVYEFLKKLDSVAAAARPMTSVVLFFAGGVPVADAVAAPLLTEAMLHIAGGTGAVLVGETALAQTTASLRTLEARFRRVQSAFTARRAGWLARQLREHLLGTLPDDLAAAANLPSTSEFARVQQALEHVARVS